MLRVAAGIGIPGKYSYIFVNLSSTVRALLVVSIAPPFICNPKDMMMKLLFIALISLFLMSAIPDSSSAQDTEEIRRSVMSQFEGAARKVSTLSKAMPEETYTWSPGEGVMSVARVYMHIARYNYYYLETSLGVPAPDDIDLDTMEYITDKATVTEMLDRSIEHVRTAVRDMPEAVLLKKTKMYGREVSGWVVLLQLVCHKKEHTGQAVSYARMNDIVPPWSN